MKIWLLVLIMVFWNQQIFIKSFIINIKKSLWNFWNLYKLSVVCSSKFKINDEKNLEENFFNQQLKGSLIKKINLNSNWFQKKSKVFLFSLLLLAHQNSIQNFEQIYMKFFLRCTFINPHYYTLE